MIMSTALLLDELWSAGQDSLAGRTFDSALVGALPEASRRYLEHAIATGTSLASAVRLHIHGEIKLKGWYPFSAEQVIRWGSGMIWRATVRIHGFPIKGGDTFLDGEGAMRWKLFGIVPMIHATGLDITRSAAGRVNLESIWLPSVLCTDQVSWTALDASHLSGPA